MSRFSRWAEREHRPAIRIAATLLSGILFAFLLPYLLIFVCPWLERQIGLHVFDPGIATYIAGGILIAVGLFFALWSIGVQLTRGRGTPLPIMPTRELLTAGPFRYCRNPMTLGTILGYLGLSIAVATVVGIVLILALGVLLIIYLKLVEEKELAERFGEAYLAYKRGVPFIIPRIPRRNGTTP